MATPEERLALGRSIGGYISGLTCLLGQGPEKEIMAYASSPITTGPLLYAIFERHGVGSAAELKLKNPTAMMDEIIKPNVSAGEAFAQSLRASGRYKHVLCPATFSAKEFGQDDYMTLWGAVIRDHSHAVHLNAGWNFSTGCVEECLIGLEQGKEVYQELSLEQLTVEDAGSQVELAIKQLAPQYDVQRLVTFAQRLMVLASHRRQEDPVAWAAHLTKADVGR